MKNKKIFGMVVIVMVLLGWYVVAQKQNTSVQPKSVVQEQMTQEALYASETIAIQNTGFVPSTVTVKEGTMVTWVNEDTVPHTIAIEGVRSTNLNNGETFEYAFSMKGSFSYSCGIHPTMKGTVIVQ